MITPLKRLFGKSPCSGDDSIGSILIRLGFITRDQLRAAIEFKLRASGETLLGEVLISQGAVTRSQLDRVLDLQKESRAPEHDYSVESTKLVAEATAHAERLMVNLETLETAARKLTPREVQVPLTLTPHGAHHK